MIKCSACFFTMSFNEFSNTVARMLDSIYHIGLTLFSNHIFGVKTLKICHYICNIVMDVIT